MKKALLLAATALLSASAAFADVRYVPTGPAVPEADQLKDGLYVIKATRYNVPKGEGLVFASEGAFGKFNDSDYSTIDEKGITNQDCVWDLALDENNYFSLRSISYDQYFAGQVGNREGQNGCILSTNATGNIAKFEAIKVTSTTSQESENPDIVIDPDVTRFVIRVTNLDNKYWYGSVLDATAVNKITCWALPKAGSMQVQFIPVKEQHSIDVTVTFPKWNGVDVVETLAGYTDDDASDLINDYIEQHGGMTGKVIKSAATGDATNLVISDDNNAFVVEGDWNYDFSPNQVYRICVNPTHMETALRYMLVTGELLTHADSEEAERLESLKRLIPERLWFFKPVENEENTYTLHNLYAPELGVHFDNFTNDAKASLTASPTPFELIPNPNLNQFYIRVAGQATAFVGDLDGKGFFTISNQTVNLEGGETPDNNSLIQIYPLTDSDFETLGLDPDIDVPYADNEVFTKAVSDWNAQNIAAAIRRIEFWGGEALIGNKPSQFNNEEGTFLEELENAKKLLAENETDVDKLNAAVKAISYENLKVYNPIIPGYFYRLKNRASGRYLSNLTGITQNNEKYMDMVLADDALYSNTVWYYMKDGDDTMLVSFDSGCVLSTVDDKASWRPVVSTTKCDDNGVIRDAAAKNVDISQQEGLWHVIHVREYQKANKAGLTHRHLHGLNAYVLAGEAESMTSLVFTDAGYQWQIELVEELPVPLYIDEDSEAAWASIYSPWPLEIQGGQAVAHTGKMVGNQIVKTEIGNIVPANTPVLLDYKKGAETPDRPDDSFRNGVMYIYLKVLYDGAPSEAAYYDNGDDVVAADSDGQELNGGILAIEKNAAVKYFTLHTSNTNNFRQYEGIQLSPAKTAAYIPGFKAHLALTDEQVATLKVDDQDQPILPIVAATTVSIDNIEAAGEGVKAVYDLQGRKLAAPVKGVNIVNGKKVLVK